MLWVDSGQWADVSPDAGKLQFLKFSLSVIYVYVYIMFSSKNLMVYNILP